MPRLKGHLAGARNIHPVLETFALHSVKHVTVYAFSTENWRRPESEVEGLLQILWDSITGGEVERLHRSGIRIRHLGKKDGLSTRLKREIEWAENLTRDNRRLGLNVAFNYGGRTEIIDAIRSLVAEGVGAEEIDERTLRQHLYIPDLPDPDLIIRTGGEMRLSNFLLWQSAYSEYYFTPVLWPDFGQEDIEKAILAYGQRQRRFGSLTSTEKDTPVAHK